MNKTKTYIELNGATYDATTGRVITKAALQNTAKAATRPSSGQVLDSVVRRGATTTTSVVSVATQTVKHAAHQAAKPARRKAQRSGTLMRQAVRKPITRSRPFHAKAAPLAAANTTKSISKPLWPSLNTRRIKHAQSTARSDRVSKFSSGKLSVRLAYLPVVPAPGRRSAKKASPQPTASHNPFHKALDQAKSHEQPKLKRQRWSHRLAGKLHVNPKTLHISAVLLAIVTVGGIVLYQNIPGLSVRMAAARAGVNASLPSYHPAGFALKGPIQYDTGELTINFQSNSDSRNFQVKQQTTSWNSDVLLQSYVTKQAQPYQTYEDNGRVVYIDNKSANLVTGNKWVQVVSDGSLSTEQLLNIVKSIH